MLTQFRIFLALQSCFQNTINSAIDRMQLIAFESRKHDPQCHVQRDIQETSMAHQFPQRTTGYFHLAGGASPTTGSATPRCASSSFTIWSNKSHAWYR